MRGRRCGISDRQSQRRRRTEQQIVDAATELFLRDGYARTSLNAVAARAGVAERTLYLRFDNKVRLFQRVIENGIVGDVDDAPLPQREWAIRAMTAATLDERIAAFADGVAGMNERLGPLMAINGEVEASEPAVQQTARHWRVETQRFLRAFWQSAADAGLLPEGADVDWLTDTGAILSAAESRLLAARTQGWDRRAYAAWLAATWRRLVTASAGSPPA